MKMGRYDGLFLLKYVLLLLVSAVGAIPSIPSSEISGAVEPIVPSPGVSNAVFALVRDTDTTGFVESLDCLFQAISKSEVADDKEAFDIIVFYEGHVEPSAEALPEGTLLANVTQYGFGSTPQDISPELVKVLSNRDLGYRHMCRFMSMEFFKALARYEYVMRLDDDLCIKEIPGDPFVTMRSEDLVYAYGVEIRENHEETRLTMTPWVRQWQLDHSDATSNAREVDADTIYFTNFFVTRVSWWSSEEVQTYLTDVDQSMNIYTHRWGDAPIQTTALKLFANPDTIVNLPMSYIHGSLGDVIHDGNLVLDPSVALEDELVADMFRSLSEMNITSANCTVNCSCPFPPATTCPQESSNAIVCPYIDALIPLYVEADLPDEGERKLSLALRNALDGKLMLSLANLGVAAKFCGSDDSVCTKASGAAFNLADTLRGNLEGKVENIFIRQADYWMRFARRGLLGGKYVRTIKFARSAVGALLRSDFFPSRFLLDPLC